MTSEDLQLDVLVMGEVNPDIVVTGVPALSFGQKEDLTGPTTMTIGSSVAITACALTRLGSRTGLVGVVGDDEFGRFILGRLRDRDVDVNRVRTKVGGRTGSSVILVRDRDSSDRQILTDPGVMGDLRADDLDLQDTNGAGHLHVGSWFLHVAAVSDLPELLAQARHRGLTTSVDPNDDPNRTWQSHLPRALGHLDVFFCNESEARGVAGSLGWPPRDDATAAARWILARLAPGGTVVLKCGADGAYAFTGDQSTHVAAPRVPVVDTVGAGDSLAAGFLHARRGGADVPAALRLAVAVGSLSTTRSGGVDGQPTWAQANALASALTITG